MKIISDTLKPLIETWDDPGDYPSNAGSGPLPRRNYFAGVDGQLVVELSPDEYQELLEYEDVAMWMSEELGYYHSEFFYDNAQIDNVNGSLVTFSILEAESKE